MKGVQEFKIYELDVHDSLSLLSDLIMQEGILPSEIIYRGTEDGHTLWYVLGYYDE